MLIEVKLFEPEYITAHAKFDGIDQTVMINYDIDISRNQNADQVVEELINNIRAFESGDIEFVFERTKKGFIYINKNNNTRVITSDA